MPTVAIDGREVQVEVRRSRRVRGTRLVVRAGQAPELVVRPRASGRQIAAALELHRDWLARQLVRLPPPVLDLGAVQLSERAARAEARARIARLVEREAAALGIRPGRLAIRDTRSRWGSCSARGTLSFSWRLVLAPADVLDYVVVHEVCHLVELNHSARFWQLVEGRRPAYRDPKRWLARHGWELHAYRPPP